VDVMELHPEVVHTAREYFGWEPNGQVLPSLVYDSYVCVERYHSHSVLLKPLTMVVTIVLGAPARAKFILHRS
jgi:hypothetical protein